MAKARFTAEQIADFLYQSKNGVPDKLLCEQYGFSISTLRRWQALHADGIRRELKQAESNAGRVFLGTIAVALLLTLALSKSIGALIIPLFLLYCLHYIRRFRAISAKHIKPENTSLARYGLGANNAFYQFCWIIIVLIICALGYGIVQLV
ncbi:transposase [Pseudescherichia sp.]|uniref:transposase n=1 Tax=Pseudescherichia sp. TaxID=2055881 RepID=UPI0028A15A05|nr:transposase [Pseudescherichia sp.]